MKREVELGSHVASCGRSLLQLLSTVVLVDTVFVTVSPQLVGRASCKVQKLIALAGSPTPFKLCIVLVVAVLLAFAGRSAWDEWWHYRIIKNKYKAQNLVRRDYSKSTHTHEHTDYTKVGSVA